MNGVLPTINSYINIPTVHQSDALPYGLLERISGARYLQKLQSHYAKLPSSQPGESLDSYSLPSSQELTACDYIQDYKPSLLYTLILYSQPHCLTDSLTH